MRKIDRRSSKPEFPLRKISHEKRVDLGRKIATQIMNSYKDAVLAIGIYGSAAKKLDRPYSDLELFCIVNDNLKLTDKFYVYDGLLVEIDYFQESKYLEEAAKKGQDWHLGADMFRSRIVLFERSNWLAKLEKIVAENDQVDFTDELRLTMIGMTESLAAVRNANIKRDRRDLRTRAFYLAWDTARVVFYHNRKYVLTTSWFWKQLFECQEQPRGLRQLIDIVAGFEKSTDKELVEAAEKLWRGTMLLVQPRGISIESIHIIV